MNVRREILFSFLETHEDAGLIELFDPVHEERHSEKCLPASRRTAQQRRTARRQTAEGEIIQSADSSRGFCEMYGDCRRCGGDFTIWQRTTS